MRLPATTPYSWALALFSKEELSTSLLFPSKKSSKPGLDPKQVERLLSKFVRSIILYDKNFDDRKGKETIGADMQGFMYNVLLLIIALLGKKILRGHLGHEDPSVKDKSEVL